MSLLLALAAACTPVSAVPTTIETIQADYHAWEGRCVRVRGIASGISLIADREAMLEDAGGFGGDARHSLVLLSGRALHVSMTPAIVDVTGVVGSCKTANDVIEAEQAAHPGEIVMVSGYCHTSLETYLTVASVQIVSRAPIPRLTEAEVAPGRRVLVEFPAGFAKARDANGAAARQMLTALTVRDETGFRRLASPDAQDQIDKLGMAGIGNGTRDQVRSAHRDYVAAAALQGPARAILKAGTAPHWLIDRRSLPYLREDGGDASYLLACWCKVGDCTGKWPVVEGDADNRPERPYLCLSTSSGYVIWPHRRAMYVTAKIAEAPGFAEPKW